MWGAGHEDPQQLIESLRARTWPGDCEAAAFRLEELRARVAELEALPGNVLGPAG